MDDKEQEINELLVEDLKAGKCVLFLGPELLVNKEGKYYKTYFKQLADENRETISQYFPKENLFAFQGNLGLKYRMLAKKVTRFYEDAGDDAILNLISQLPFSLIINVSPDTALNKVFAKNNYPFRSAYFPDPKASGIEAPSKENPVIYNIFGSIEDEQSIIMSHKKLFETIIELMQKDSIPINIRDFMKTASSFIFLGLKFETWYYQLLLSILGFNNESITTTRVGVPREVDVDTVSVMNSCFQIDFSNLNPNNKIEELYNSIKKDSPKNLKQPQKPVIKGSAYFSYAWRDIPDADKRDTNTVAAPANYDREEVVDKIYNQLTEKYDVTIYRDKNVLTLQDSIQSFMNRIGQGKVVIIVVSDKYLKSEYCMYEAWEIYKNDRFKERAFLVVQPDVNLNGGANNYLEYWRDKKNDLENEIKEKFSNDSTAADKLIAKNRTLMYIYLFIGAFIEILQDTLYPKILQSDPQANEATVNLLVSEIAKKLNEE